MFAPVYDDLSIAAARKAVGEWLDGAWDPGLTVREWWARLAESGWGHPTWPKEWFGRDMPDVQAEAVAQEMAGRGVLGPPVGIGPDMGAKVILVHGTEEQKRRYLPGVASGEENWCQFFSEPGAGSDLASVQTRAGRDGEEWVVNGQKVWNSGTIYADRGLLVARTDIDVPKHRGMSYFIIDVDQPGLEIRPIRQMNGRAEFNETFFTDARVADDARIGAVGDGFRVAMTTLSSERATYAGGGAHLLVTCVSGQKAGNLDRTVADVVKEVLERSAAGEDLSGANTPAIHTPEQLISLARQHGRSSDPVIRQRIARVYAFSEALRFTGLRAQASARSGQPAGVESSVGYVGGVRVLRLCRDLCGEIAGAAATIDDGPGSAEGVATTILTVPCHGIQGGSEQIQMNIIGERILGLPKEPQVDRDSPFRDLKVGTQRA